MSKPKENVVGNTYGQLTVLDEDGYKGKSRQVLVRCTCGNERTVSVSNLKKGTTTSCGCFHKSRVTLHGKSRDRFYKTWYGMMERCNNPQHQAFDRYGGKGITVCPEWQNLAIFLSWAHSCGDTASLSLDRIDNTQGYSPTNCRWASRTTQQRNRSNVRGSTSQYIGVCYYKNTGKWKAHIKVNKVLIHLGYFLNEEDAARARNQYIVDHNLKDFTLNKVPT